MLPPFMAERGGVARLKRIEIPMDDARAQVAPESLEDVLQTLCSFKLIQGFTMAVDRVIVRFPAHQRTDLTMFALELSSNFEAGRKKR